MKNKDKRYKYVAQNAATLAALFVIAVWGETFVSSKVILNEGLLPDEIFLIRFLLAYLGMSALSHKKLWANSFADELKLMALGVLGGSLYFLSENMALMYSTASNVAILVGSTPLITAILLSIFHKEERMRGRQIVGSIIAFVGMALVIFNGHFVLHLNPRGDLLALGAALTWGFYSLVMKRLSSRYEASFITRKVFAYGVLSILPYIMLGKHDVPQLLAILQSPKVWINLLYLGLVASMLCYFAWNWVLSRLGIVRATNILYLQSFFTMIVSHIVLNDNITIMAIGGSIVLIGGMILAIRQKN